MASNLTADVKVKQAERDQIAEQVEEFIAAGGKIDHPKSEFKSPVFPLLSVGHRNEYMAK